MPDFEYSYTGVGEWLRSDPDLTQELHTIADRALAFAKAIAPIGDPAAGDEHPGHYRDSLEVSGPYVQGRRVTFHLEANAVYSREVEDRHQVLAKTVAVFSDPKGA